MKKIPSILFSLSALIVLFLSPVIWEKYYGWFGIDLNKPNTMSGFAVLLTMVFFIFAMMFLSYYTYPKDNTND